MTADQALLDMIANSMAIQHGSPLSSRQFFVFNVKPLVQLLRNEQTLLVGSGNRTRRISGVLKLMDVALSGNRTSVPAIIVIGAHGGTSGSDGEDAQLTHNQAGHVLIAAGGSATPKLNSTTRGGNAFVSGTAESLLVAIGGDGATPLSPATMPYGANGSDGGDGGNAACVATGDGNVLYAWAGTGKKGSPGQIGRPASGIVLPYFGRIFGSPPGPAGTNGADGDGGDARVIGRNNSDFFARGGSAPAAGTTLATLPGTTGAAGTATAVTGTVDVVMIGLTNGDGTKGSQIQQ